MKISVQPGKRLDVAINVSRNDMATVEAVIYDENRKQLNRLNEDTDETQFMLFYVPGNVGQGVRPYYVSVKNTSTYRDIVKNVSVNLSLADVSDAQSGIDAGEDFTNALVIQPGAYKGFLAGGAGSDHKDFYRVSVKRGQELSVKVTPVSDAAYFINIYDVNRKEIKQVFPENPGQILTASWFTPSDQDAYILIVRSEGGSRNYDFEIAVSQAKPGVEKEQTKKQEQKYFRRAKKGVTKGKTALAGG